MKKIGMVLMVLACMAWPWASNARAAEKGIVIDGSTTVGPIAKSFAAYFMNTYNVPMTVSESGSGNGAKSLINGTCDIADMSRSMKPQELEAAKTKGVDPVAHVVALDGIAMVVHPSNPVRSLTIAQIADIYTGRVRNWRQVGGPNFPVVVIQRESNSGTQETFRELALNKRKVVRSAETQASNGAVKNRVSQTPGAIGFLGLGYVDSSVKPIAVNKVKPSSATVKDGTYPLSRPLYMYTNGKPAGMVGKFINLPKTPDGKKIIQELGFISKY
ncbi:MAG TPA: phosphate ABC transporter substrate-binding protein [Chlorobaculum parvum]|uniref:Phosphate-binding protein n=1 Tax=Chlorobaculum parvum TaxID=274539 RepID=A0A7C5DI89_9CHLB|nr:phosphate ABC transporter substrate-binding protein [Chlorobaculum parvum]